MSHKSERPNDRIDLTVRSADVVEERIWKGVPRRVGRRAGWTFSVLVLAGCVLRVSSASDDSKPTELVGTWRGASTCTDRVAAPACRDEVVVYEFAVGAKSGTVHWKADKVVDGQRQLMGEMDVVYDRDDKCWKAEFISARVHSVWCLVVDGDHLTGTARLLPGKETVRRIHARRD